MLLRQTQPESKSLHAHGGSSRFPVQADTPVEAVAYAVILLFVSAVWYESDAYRYAALLLLLPALTYYWAVDFFSPDRPRIGFMGLLCVAWGLYVAARYAYTSWAHPDMADGTSEGIYLLPLLYPTFGYALWLYVRRPFVIAAAFIFISFIAVLYGADISSLALPRRADFSLHQNPIHAAGATALIVVCVLPFMSYVFRRKEMSDGLRISLVAMAALTFAIGLANIYGLHSKGAWLALAIALPFQIALAVLMHSARATMVFAAVFLAVFGLALIVAWDGISTVAGATYYATIMLVENIIGSGWYQGVDRAIDNEALPSSFRQRLMLWASAILIWKDNPLFGFGITWEHLWGDRAYPQTPFNLLHNGYLEIAIRYGFLGLAFYFVLFAWTIRKVWQAARYGLIDVTALQAYLSFLVLFCGSILTNSNIRLALGESYMMMAAGFGFYCFYLLQQNGYARARSWV